MDTRDIVAAKAETRRAVAETLAQLTPSCRRAAGIAVAQRVAGLPVVQAARTLMAFLSLPTEIDTWPLIRWAWGEGKRIAVPRIEAGGSPGERTMTAVILPPADVEGVAMHPAVRPGPLGILEVLGAPPLAAAELDVLLMPCHAVDRRGNRLGKGGGFFDRFLKVPGLRAARIVLAFHEQVLDEVPVGEHDVPVEMIVSDAEVLTFKAGGVIHIVD
jgi:5-formyltetrahydrofolate cyclo-ligase